MTEPGNLNQLVPKGRDWIPRGLADLKRQIRRNSSGHSPWDRISLQTTVAAASLTGTSYAIPAWDFILVNDGGVSIVLNSPDDGGIYLLARGLYTVTATLSSSTIHLAAATHAIALLTSSGELDTTLGVQFRGGDGAAGFSATINSSTTQLCPGRAFSGGIFATLAYHNLDAAMTSVAVVMDVQRIS